MEFCVDRPRKRAKARCKGDQVEAEGEQDRHRAKTLDGDEGDRGGGQCQGDQEQGGEEKSPPLPDRDQLKANKGEYEVDSRSDGCQPDSQGGSSTSSL